MKRHTYSISINKSRDTVFNKLVDKELYPRWARAWGAGMRCEGEWTVGGHISYFDSKRGGTRVVIEEFVPGESIKTKHVAMVDPENVDVELADETMRKWIGSQEDYAFMEEHGATTFRVEMTADEAFDEMMNAWPQALEYFKEACEA
ncbi:MAG: SRPBCC domain-containing protein [Pseudomonadota bacterium]